MHDKALPAGHSLDRTTSPKARSKLLATELPNRELAWILHLAEAERLSLVLPDAMEQTYGR